MPALMIRDDINSGELHRRARRENDGRVSARLIAIANALDGMDRASAARLAGMPAAEPSLMMPGIIISCIFNEQGKHVEHPVKTLGPQHVPQSTAAHVSAWGRVERSHSEMMVLEEIYEQDFLPCSYGFRPGRSAHHGGIPNVAGFDHRATPRLSAVNRLVGARDGARPLRSRVGYSLEIASFYAVRLKNEERPSRRASRRKTGKGVLTRGRTAGRTKKPCRTCSLVATRMMLIVVGGAAYLGRWTICLTLHAKENQYRTERSAFSAASFVSHATARGVRCHAGPHSVT
jgi:hypothetical protein